MVKKIPHTVRNPQANYPVYRSPPHFPFLNQTTIPVHDLPTTSHSWTRLSQSTTSPRPLNDLPTSSPRPPISVPLRPISHYLFSYSSYFNLFVSFGFPHQNRLCISILPCMQHMPRPSRPPWFDHAKVASGVDCVWNVMAHAQKPDFFFQRNGRVHLNRPEGGLVQSTTGSRGVQISGQRLYYL